MLRFPAQILPMMGFSSCDDSDVFQWLKIVSIGRSCSEPFSHLHQRYSVHDPPHPGVGGMHLRHLDPLTKTSRGGSSPMSPPALKCCPRALQGLHRCLLRRGLFPPPPSQSMGPHHRAPP